MSVCQYKKRSEEPVSWGSANLHTCNKHGEDIKYHVESLLTESHARRVIEASYEPLVESFNEHHNVAASVISKQYTQYAALKQTNEIPIIIGANAIGLDVASHYLELGTRYPDSRLTLEIHILNIIGHTVWTSEIQTLHENTSGGPVVAIIESQNVYKFIDCDRALKFDSTIAYFEGTLTSLRRKKSAFPAVESCNGLC